MATFSQQNFGGKLDGLTGVEPRPVAASITKGARDAAGMYESIMPSWVTGVDKPAALFGQPVVPDIHSSVGNSTSNWLDGFSRLNQSVNTGLGKPAVTTNATDTKTDTKTTDMPAVSLGGGADRMVSQVDNIVETLDTTFNSFMSISDDVETAFATFDELLTAEMESAKDSMPDAEVQKQRDQSAYDYEKLAIEKEKTLAEERYNRAIQQENQAWDVKQGDLDAAQKKETGATSMGLARAGGYLGFTGSHQATLATLEQTHAREQSMLQSLRSQALNEIRVAFEDKNMELLRDSVKSYKELMTNITQRENDHFNQLMQVTQEARAKVTAELDFNMQERDFQYGRGMDMINMMQDSVASGVKPTNEEIMKYAQATGIDPNLIAQAWTASRNTYELDEKRKDQELAASLRAEERDLISILTRIDKGTFINYQGKQYEGLNTPSSSGSSGAGKASDGYDAITVDDWQKDFNSNPWVEELVGVVSKQQLLQMFSPGQSTAPDWYIQKVLPDIAMMNGFVPDNGYYNIGDGLYEDISGNVYEQTDSGEMKIKVSGADRPPENLVVNKMLNAVNADVINGMWQQDTKDIWGGETSRNLDTYQSSEQTGMANYVSFTGDDTLASENLPPMGNMNPWDYLNSLSTTELAIVKKLYDNERSSSGDIFQLVKVD